MHALRAFWIHRAARSAPILEVGKIFRMNIEKPDSTQGPQQSEIYMLRWGLRSDQDRSGPFRGAADLDFNALTEAYQRDRHAAAQSKQEDYCLVWEDDFVDWLLETGVLSRIATKDVEIKIPERAYTPDHWPLCPECALGRGERRSGERRFSLNRIKLFRCCTSCGHEWEHAEEPLQSGHPMLDDDGRDTPGACVPFAISKACGLDFSTVLKVCANHGWSENGMDQPDAISAARKLGFNLIWRSWAGVGTANAPTLKRLVATLPTGRNYIVGVKGHWLAVVDGHIVDNDNNTGLGHRVYQLFEVCLAQAAAA